MKLVRLTLENLRSYRNETVEFPEGTLLIHGENGAGKTSLLMGVFGGLFLSDISYVGNYNLDDLITRGETKARIELVFEVEGVAYTVEWEFYRTSTPPEATLSSPQLETPVSGVRDVKTRLEEILGMSREDFVSSVYVRQGEINRLIEGNDRTELIDSLLNLDVIDQYITRVEGAKKAARDVQDHAEVRREAAEEELQSIDYDADELQRRLAQTDDEMAEVEAEQEEIESFIDDLEGQRDARESTLDGYQETAEKLSQREQKLDSKHQTRSQKIEEKETATSKIATCTSRIEEVRAEISTVAEAVEYDISTAEAADAAVDNVHSEYTAAREAVATAEGDLETAKTEVDELRTDLNEVTSELEDARGQVDDREASLEKAETRVEELEASLETALDARDSEAADLLDIDPATVDDQTRTDVDDTRQDADERRLAAEKELTKLQAELSNLETDIEETQTELSEARDRLEAAEQRCETKRTAVNEAEARVEELEAEFEDRVTELQAAADPFDIDVTPESLTKLRDDTLPALRDDVQEDINTRTETVARLETTIDALESDIDEMEGLEGTAECPTCKQDVSPEHLETERAELQSELETTVSERDEVTADIEELEARKSAVDALLEDVTSLIAFRNDEVAEARADLETAESEFEEAQTERDDVNATVDALSEELDELKEERAEQQDTLEDVREQIDRLETTIADCDEVLEAFEEAEAIRDDLADAQDEVADATETLEDAEAEVENLVTERNELQEAIEEQQDVVQEREAALEAAEEHAADIEETKETLETVEAWYDEISELETEIEGHKQTVTNADETIDELNSDIADLESQIDALEDTLGDTDPESLKEEIARIEEKIEEREKTVADLDADLNELREQRIQLENVLESYRTHEAKAEWFGNQEAWAAAVEAELDTVLAAYRSSKSQLRQEYLGYLREYTNQIFDEVYRNGNYQQVVIQEVEEKGEKVYDLKLLREDNELEDPVNASGGERAVVNLALRAGIYRLIAEIEGGDSGRLPPFILDEPTTFLDEGHVGQLERLLNTLREWDVPQVLVVSHEKSLKDGADHACRVYYDPERNSSRTEMQRADEAVTVADGGTATEGSDSSGQGPDRKDDDDPRHN